MHNVLQMSERSRTKYLAFKERHAAKLAGRCQSRDADIFWLRFERYFEDVYHPLTRLYGDRSDVDAQVEALFEVMVCSSLRLPTLRRRRQCAGGFSFSTT